MSGLDEQINHVVELYPYISHDELSALAYKVKMQKKLKGKNPIPKRTRWSYGFQNHHTLLKSLSQSQTRNPLKPPLHKHPQNPHENP